MISIKDWLAGYYMYCTHYHGGRLSTEYRHMCLCLVHMKREGDLIPPSTLHLTEDGYRVYRHYAALYEVENYGTTVYKYIRH